MLIQMPLSVWNRLVVALVALAGVNGLSVTVSWGSDQVLRRRIEERVAADPQNASNWRMMGKLRERDGDAAGARQAYQAALQIDPENAAAHMGLARLSVSSGSSVDVRSHCERVLQIAPDSDYAIEARRLLSQLADSPPASPEPGAGQAGFPEWPGSSASQHESHAELLNPLYPGMSETDSVQQAGYEIARFDNSGIIPDAEEVLEREEPNRLRLRLESGAVYNSNVSLTPVNRELFPGSQDTAQFFLAPELEYRAVDGDEWGAGPSFLGHFTFNESSFENLNLQSYQPGAFLERVFAGSPTIVVTRLQYGLTHDEFDGQTIGNRHSVMASAAAVWDGASVTDAGQARTLTFGYLSADHTDIANDGLQPALSSRDGWTYRIGAAHTLGVNSRFLRSVRLGLDLDHADLAGDNFAYNGVSTYVAWEIPVVEKLQLDLEGGWGYRDYPDFGGSPSRNEHIWRAGARLIRQLDEHWSVGGVFNYDRFDSDNALFAAERYLAGVILVFER